MGNLNSLGGLVEGDSVVQIVGSHGRIPSHVSFRAVGNYNHLEVFGLLIIGQLVCITRQNVAVLRRACYLILAVSRVEGSFGVLLRTGERAFRPNQLVAIGCRRGIEFDGDFAFARVKRTFSDRDLMVVNREVRSSRRICEEATSSKCEGVVSFPIRSRYGITGDAAISRIVQPTDRIRPVRRLKRRSPV